eukprot:CAMPEP_0173380798 /NCGR_PEP_ID=MMETSP1356-20130122/3408_1 /TAXON_ID=77927 ORGANISM="Hemiselmis virescens, Strain PCC157" /NCGR_SAMPLE_ID=MMETSP1356 /ASSEMBLY_ACC=CAM_ASM_000847 /LENGTH=140 /DNA_ID=CAMNT_0014334505 /DNA_START=24 /DNA_END=446 /DNA_ORIENTATION=+
MARLACCAAIAASLFASADAFGGLGGPLGVLRTRQSASSAHVALQLRMSDRPRSDSVQPDTGRGNEEDIAAAFFRDQEAQKVKEAEDALKPKRVFEEVDAEQEAWKAGKEKEKADQAAETEAKMQQWMKAAADKKAAEGK